MKVWPILLLGALLACRAPQTAPEDAGAESAVTVAPSRAAHESAEQLRPPAPPGERVALVPAGIVPGDYQVPPPAVVGRPPSAAHPHGTVFVAAMHGTSERDDVTPYVAEWDLQNERVVHQWASPRAGRLNTVPKIAFDGRNLFVHTAWNENPDPDGEVHEACRIDVLDGKMRTARSRPSPCGSAITEAREGGVLLHTFGFDEAAEAVLTLQLFGPGLRIRATAKWHVPQRPLYADHYVLHAGDSFYLLVAADDATLRIARLDDRTLRERARSPSLGEVDPQSYFSKSDDGWVVTQTFGYWRVSPLLERATFMTDHERAVGLEAWHGKRYLSYQSAPEGSYLEYACAPLWAFENPLFVCAIDSELAVVRSSLEDVRSVLE